MPLQTRFSRAGDLPERRASDRAPGIASRSSDSRGSDWGAVGRGSLEFVGGAVGMGLSAGAAATGAGLALGAAGAAISSAAMSVGLARAIGGLSGMSSEQFDAIDDIANPFGAAAAAGAGMLGGTGDQMQFAGKLGALTGNLATGLGWKSFHDWKAMKELMKAYGFSDAAIEMARVAGHASNAASKYSLGADVYDLYGDVTGYRGDRDKHAGRDYLGVGDLRDTFGGHGAGDRSERGGRDGAYSGKGSLLGDKDLNRDFGFGSDYDGGGDFGGDSDSDGGDDGWW